MTKGVLEQLVADEAAAAVSRIANRVERELRAMPSAVSGSDTGLTSVWLGYAAQAQGEESAEWALYEELVRDRVAVALDGLPQRTLIAIWLQTYPGEVWLQDHRTAESAPPWDRQDVIERAALEVYGQACRCRSPRVRRFLALFEEE